MSLRRRRATAIKLKIADLSEGELTADQDGSQAVQVKTGDLVKRARIMGEISNKIVIENEETVLLDLVDDSGSIKVKGGGSEWYGQVFIEMKDLKEGILIDVIGLVKESDGQVYLQCELCIPVADPSYKVMRDLEIAKYYSRKGLAGDAVAGIESAIKGQKDLTETDEIKDQIIALLKQPEYLKEGCPFDKIKKTLALTTNEVESALRSLQADGEIFEPIPGTFKYV